MGRTAYELSPTLRTVMQASACMTLTSYFPPSTSYFYKNLVYPFCKVPTINCLKNKRHSAIPWRNAAYCF